MKHEPKTTALSLRTTKEFRDKLEKSWNEYREEQGIYISLSNFIIKLLSEKVNKQ